jgi:protein-S-isoprenylcysteine O-methyltransferase Ste14
MQLCVHRAWAVLVIRLTPEIIGTFQVVRNTAVVKSQTSPLILLPPPLLYAVCFGLGMLLDRLLPWSPGWMHGRLVHWIGWLLLGAAAVLAISSAGLFWLRRTTIIPHGQPSRLITKGPFALSRNPIYVAVTVAYCGVALLTASPWPLVLLIAPVTYVHRIVIPFEEARLNETFGATYADYRRRVGRWL